MGGSTGRGRIRLEQQADRTVVVKRAESSEHRVALAHEAARLRAMAHPGLVQVVDFEEAAAYSELSTSYAGALTLADFSPSSLGSAAGVVAGVAAVVADMHAAGVSHGALLGEHVILGASRHPVLCSLAHATPAEPEAIARDLRALGALLEATARRCPPPANRMARRQANAIGDVVQLARRSGATASEVAAVLAGLPGATVPDVAPVAGPAESEPRSDTETTRTWRGRVPPHGPVSGFNQRRIGFVLWCVGLVVTLWVLRFLGSAGLAVPLDPTIWTRWLREVGTATAIVSVLRLLALTCAWYLTAVTLAGVLGRRSGMAQIVIVTNRASPAFLRSLLGSAAGLGISAVGLTIAVAPLVATPPQPAPPSLVTASAGSAAPSGGVDSIVPRAPAEATAASSVDPTVFQTPGLLAGTGGALPDDSGSFELDIDRSVEPDTADVWVVQTGDHLWHIAEETLRDLWGRQPDQVEIDAYWRRLVELNGARLVAPDNPDLLYPDQVMLLPAP